MKLKVVDSSFGMAEIEFYMRLLIWECTKSVCWPSCLVLKSHGQWKQTMVSSTLLSQFLLVMKLGPSVCKACSLAMGSTVLTCCRAGMPAVHSVHIWGCCYTTVSLAPDNTPAVPVGLRSAPSVLVEQIWAAWDLYGLPGNGAWLNTSASPTSSSPTHLKLKGHSGLHPELC